MSSLLLFIAALLAVMAAAEQNGGGGSSDFAFDLADDFEVEMASPFPAKREVTAVVGKVLHIAVSKDVFGKDVKGYEAKVDGRKTLPSWLLFDKTDGIFWGVPLPSDIGTFHITVQPVGTKSAIVHDFDLNVREILPEDDDPKHSCTTAEDKTVLTLLLDKEVAAIKPKYRVIAIDNIAKFFGLPYSAFVLTSQTTPDEISDRSVILAGPGNVKNRISKETSVLRVPVGCEGRLWVETAPIVHQLKEQARDGTISEVLQLPLIGWRVKTETRSLRNKRQAETDGSGDFDYYEEYGDDYDYDDGDDDGKVTELPSSSTTPSTTTTSTTTTTTTTTTTIAPETHPHRHHHGEPKVEVEPEVVSARVPLLKVEPPSSTPDVIDIEGDEDDEVIETEPPLTSSSTTTTTTTTTTAKPVEEEKTTITSTTTTTEAAVLTSLSTGSSTSTQQTTVKGELPVPDEDGNYDEGDYEDEYIDEDEESETVVPDVTPKKQTTPHDVIEVDTEPSVIETTKLVPETTKLAPEPTSTEKEVAITMVESEEPSTVTTTSTTTSTTTTTETPVVATMKPTTSSTTLRITTLPEEEEETEEDTTPFRHTTLRHVAYTSKTTPLPVFTENIEYEVKNFPPTIQNRLKRLAVTAGKMFTYVIPENTFSDMEDGTNLVLEFLDSDGQPVKQESWCQFNAITREIYGLPLDEDVSRWEFVVKATDKEGASTADHLEILVQQHKAKRVVNHEFSLFMRIEKRNEFKHRIDWPLKTLKDLGRLYHSNGSEITVRSVNYTSDPVVFTWTNDSLPTNFCPHAEVEELFKELTINNRGDPAPQLGVLLGPELVLKKVAQQGLGVCEPQPKPPMTPPTNFSPILRNPVDHINATVGELLVFKVPDDTFYDPEDVDPRMLQISLLAADRKPLPANHWLQFDSKNREFYGIPKEPGRSEYQLECRDSGGLPASDSLELVVYPAPKVQYNVEFGITIAVPYSDFAISATLQRKFVERLQELFGDKNASNIRIGAMRDHDEGTFISWYNKTLISDKCQHDKISRLESVLRHNDRSVSSRVDTIMRPDFPVSSIKITMINKCKAKPKPQPPPPEVNIPPSVNEEATLQSGSSEEYLITFIVPAVIISIMLFLAGVAACVLYRRRRTGKMNVEEDGRGSYGNKGIPVIFQEELDEKPESGTKTPVILKDEKPPLAPPEYSKSGSLKTNDDSEPYQPPPPFTRTQDNGRQPRPKPTPTYRKPPPYVPP